MRLVSRVAGQQRVALDAIQRQPIAPYGASENECPLTIRKAVKKMKYVVMIRYESWSEEEAFYTIELNIFKALNEFYKLFGFRDERVIVDLRTREV